jgi:putative nucleotidyltransferase with HDIG domain
MHEPESYRTKVLFVDDEENILKSLKRLLMDEDIDILTATSGEQGLAVLRDTPEIGLIVSDQRMPGLTGADFLKQAREIAPDALRIMLTGYADINATIDAINKGGAYRYISKPWDDEEMIRTIRDANRQCSLIAENRRLSALVKKQNEELKEWNSNLKNRVLEQTAATRVRNDELRDANEKLQKNYENCLAAFYGLVELRDRETKNHAKNVARLAATVAEKIGLTHAEVETVKIAALLHDIGKISMSYRLLQLDAEGINIDGNQEYRQHPAKGQGVIAPIEELQSAGVLIRHHHENFDGSGFPDRLRGDAIPTGARIIALADCFDRLYAKNRSDNPVEMALQAVKGETGIKFDPQIFSFLEQPAIEIYEVMGKKFDRALSALIERAIREKRAKFLDKTDLVEMELTPDFLREGMIIAGDVRTDMGRLLLSSGEHLDAAQVEALRNTFRNDKLSDRVLVRFYFSG